MHGLLLTSFVPFERALRFPSAAVVCWLLWCVGCFGGVLCVSFPRVFFILRLRVCALWGVCAYLAVDLARD